MLYTALGHWIEIVVLGLIPAGVAGYWAHIAVEKWRHRQCEWQDGYDEAHGDAQAELDDLDAELDDALAERDMWRQRAEQAGQARRWPAPERERAEPATLVGVAHPPPRFDGTSRYPGLVNLARERLGEHPAHDAERTPSAEQRAAMLSELSPEALDAENGRFADAPMGDVAEPESAGEPDEILTAPPGEPRIAAIGDAAYIPADEFARARAAVLAAHGGVMPEPLQRVIDAGGRFAMPAPRHDSEPPQPRLIRDSDTVAATAQIPAVTDAPVAEPAFVTDLMGERGADSSAWFREQMAAFAPEHRVLAIEAGKR